MIPRLLRVGSDACRARYVDLVPRARGRRDGEKRRPPLRLQHNTGEQSIGAVS